MPELKQIADSSVEHLRLALSVGHIGIWQLDLATGQAWRNLQHDQIFGYDEPLPEWTYEQFLDHVIAEDRDRVDEAQTSAIEKGEDWIFECRIIRADGAERWISASGRPLTDEQGEVTRLIGHVIDITETKRNEMRLQVLTAELNHRVRNLLAMIKSMVSLSARRASNVDEFAHSLEGRVAALARTHDLLVVSAEQTFNPASILEREMDAFAEFKDQMQIRTAGRPMLKGVKAEGFSLVVHELITNAIKYGALSVRSGHVEVEIAETATGVRMSWTESGGPPVEGEVTSGFGTRMIRMVLGDPGHVDLDFRREGLACSFDIPN